MDLHQQTLARREVDQTLSFGTSMKRRSFQLFRAHSTSWTPLAPSTRSHLNGSSATTWRMKASHWILKPLPNSAYSGTGCQPARKSIGCFTSGFQTGLGVFTRDWVTTSVKPATAEPCVPSTWNVTRSSRRTRVVQEL